MGTWLRRSFCILATLCRGRAVGRLRFRPAAWARPLTASLAETAGFDDSAASTSRTSSEREAAATDAFEAPATDVFAFLGVGAAFAFASGAVEAAAEMRRDEEREGVPGVASNQGMRQTRRRAGVNAGVATNGLTDRRRSNP